MSLACLEFERPTIFRCVAGGLAQSSLNPTFGNLVAAPLRFVAALVVVVVSPLFAACDLLIYVGACIGFSIAGRWSWALENLQDCGRLLVRFIPDTLSFPFVFAYAPDRFLR